jgi:hypothetical protein
LFFWILDACECIERLSDDGHQSSEFELRRDHTWSTTTIWLVTLFSYTIPIDDGAAPNPFGGICTLTICKPAIRRKAAVGDWVVGLGSKRASRDFSGRVVYAMKVTRVLTIQQYDEYCSTRLPIKLPDWTSSRFEKRVGDCIYTYAGRGAPKMRVGIRLALEHLRVHRELP